MVIMIFKFFLQSKEYKFFVRRLKNVADTRSVLTAEKRLETKISELEEAKPSGPLAKSI